MTWLSDTLPSAPQALEVTIDKHITTLTWEETGADVMYNVYSSNTFPVDTDNAVNLQCTYISEPYYTEATQSIVHPRHYAITTIDRYGNESAPLQWENDRIHLISPK